jgi:hypothetical protein
MGIIEQGPRCASIEERHACRIQRADEFETALLAASPESGVVDEKDTGAGAVDITF